MDSTILSQHNIITCKKFFFLCLFLRLFLGDKDRIREALENLRNAMDRYNNLAGDRTEKTEDPHKKRALENALKGTSTRLTIKDSHQGLTIKINIIY